MRRGARDYIEKPWDDDRLLAAVRTQIELRRALRRNQRLQEANARLQRGATPAFIGDAPAIVEIRRTIERVAPSDASVLITGEHGTGKEVVAAWLHALSDRRSKAAGDDERGRSGGRDRRERAVRPRQGRLHRRARRSDRLLRDGRRGHAVPRRNRQHADAAAGQAAARAADGRARARRLLARALRQRPRAVGDQREPRRPRSPADASAKTSSTASTPWSFTFRRCESGTSDIEPLAHHFLAIYASRYRKPLGGIRRRRDGGAAGASVAGQRARAGAQRRARGPDGRSGRGIDRARGIWPARPAAEPAAADEVSLEEAERIFIEKVLARHSGDVRLAAEQLGMSRSALYRRLQQYGVRD